MYKVNEDNIKMLADALNYLDLVEVKGVRNCNSVVMIANLVQQFVSSMEKEQDGVVVDNTSKGSDKDKSGE